MLRRRIQRASFITNVLGYSLLLCVVTVHVVHRYSAANVSGGDDGEITFWFEGPQEGDDQPQHHRPFHLLNTRVLLGVCATFLVAALCDAGGIAGAGLFVPVFCLVVGFGLKASTGLAQAAIAGVSLASLVFTSLFRTHPWDVDRTLVDFDLALLLTPSLLLGVTVGVMLNDLLPDWFINILLVGLLMYVCNRKILRGLLVWDEEAQHEINVLAAAVIGSRPMPQLRPLCINLSHADSSSSSSDAGSPPQQQQQQQHEKSEEIYEDNARSSSGDGNALAADQSPASDPSTPPTPRRGSSSSSIQRQPSFTAAVAAAMHAHWQQPQQQQQQQCIADDDNSSCSSDLNAPLLSPTGRWMSHVTITNNSVTNNTAAAAFAPRTISSLLPPPAAAAAAVRQQRLQAARQRLIGYLYPSYFQTMHATRFPWLKFCSVWLLWLGFCGLSVLNSLIPLCSWYYINYMLSFLGLTTVMTMFITGLVLTDPCSSSSKLVAAANMEEGRATTVAAAAAANAAAATGSSGCFSATRAAAVSCRRHLVIWMNVLTGTTFKPYSPAAAAAAAAAADSSDNTQPTMSLYKQALLQQQQEQLAAAAAEEDEEPFPYLGSPTAAGQQQANFLYVAAAAAPVAAAAGIASGVCGVAGGALLTPILLDFRIHPQVAAATSLLLVFMSSSGAVLSYVMQGRLVLDYAMLFFAVAVLGACVGVTLVGALVRPLHCPASVVILTLAGLVGLACVSSAVYGVREFVHDYTEGEGLGFRALCSYT